MARLLNVEGCFSEDVAVFGVHLEPRQCLWGMSHFSAIDVTQHGMQRFRRKGCRHAPAHKFYNLGPLPQLTGNVIIIVMGRRPAS
mmetsp:Transcript_45132/g.73912  ORF Transcript_45132/g.73912 Transcript_45132/m.73912 type:complete len:85 (+) Transcript_45132:780-1034(+)